MELIKNKLKSIRIRLFLTLILSVVLIITFFIIINNVVLEPFYLYSKQENLLEAYEIINNYYKNSNEELDLSLELEKIALSNDFDIMIKTDEGISVYTSSNRDFLSTVGSIAEIESTRTNRNNILFSSNNISIKKLKDTKTNINVIFLSAKLENDYDLYIRLPITSIQESVKITNKFLFLIGGITILISGIAVIFISKRFTEPILELNEIAKKMSNLDFSKKYRIKDIDDELNTLGKSINTMSDELERTIKELKRNNIELERDIEEKSKIDEMRKQFISDVSHELKTPIALIQGYAEGLTENVITDEQSKSEYLAVILDEANKMDTLVKQLLELMKLEYGKREFNNTDFNITELIKEVKRKCKVMIDEVDVEVQLNTEETIYVNADEFYIEQVITNYLTNAIKNVDTVNGEKIIKIEVTKLDKEIEITVFNTGKQIDEAELMRIWNRFYKIDTSRNRQKGGTGIGLAFVKAIMNNYEKDYGVRNKENGVEFYFKLNSTIEK